MCANAPVRSAPGSSVRNGRFHQGPPCSSAVAPSRAATRGWRGRPTIAEPVNCATSSACRASGPMRARQAAPSGPRASAVRSMSRYATAARPPSRGCAYDAVGVTNRTRFSSPNRRKKPDANASGCTAEQMSCRKPGSVISSVRIPPPAVAFRSYTRTDNPARARVTAADSPFGPEPITTASSEESEGIPPVYPVLSKPVPGSAAASQPPSCIVGRSALDTAHVARMGL